MNNPRLRTRSRDGLPTIGSATNPLKRTIIVQHFRPPERPTRLTRAQSVRASVPRRRPTRTLPQINSKPVLPPQPEKINETVDFLNGTIQGSEWGTIRTDRNSLDGTMTIELRGAIANYRDMTKSLDEASSKAIDESQMTLDLLEKIRRTAQSKPIGPMPLSQQACRFELPFDLRILERLTPLEYLGQYCRVSARRQYQFKRIFNRHRNREYLLDSSDLYSSIIELHKENFTRSTYVELCRLIDLDDQRYQFTFEIFAGILAFSERLLCNAFLRKNDHDHVLLSKDPIERCDFDSLTRKFDGLAISEKIKQLLNSL